MSDLQMTTASGPAKERANIASVQGQLLVLVLDMNPNQMFFARHPQCLIDWLNAALALANSHLMLNPANSIAAVAAHSESCSFLYPNEDTQNEAGSIRQRDGQFEGFYLVESTIRRKITNILREESTRVYSDSLLSGALCMALSYINRQKVDTPTGLKPPTSRMLVMSASGDSPTQYMNYMNVFFSSQKMGVLIDTCMVDKDSGLLQQGADITGGIYRKISAERHFPALLQFLQWIYLPDARLRDSLSLPTMERVDYRAACFCHRLLIDNGFVCSVCLSIFCKFSPICTTCNTVFKMPGQLMVGGKRKKLGAGASPQKPA